MSTHKKTCKVCGDKYTPLPDENHETRICDECFEMQESSEQNMEYEQYSDADPGL